jgi:hypothetical protein
VTINLLDLTPGSPTFGQVIGTGQTDAFGLFTAQVNAGAYTTDGLKVIGVQAVDQSGTRGNIGVLSFTLDTSAPVVPTGLDLLAASDSFFLVVDAIGPHIFPVANGNTDNYTNVTNPSFSVGGIEGGTIVSLLRDGVRGGHLAHPAGPLGQTITLTDPGPVPDRAALHLPGPAERPGRQRRRRERPGGGDHRHRRAGWCPPRRNCCRPTTPAGATPTTSPTGRSRA